jgi:O-antigen biosynthesis protein
MMSALVLTYHAIEPGAGPLHVDPRVFETHLDVLREAGATCVTVSVIAAQLRLGTIAPRTVAITFDDGLASVPRTAAPLLVRSGMPATVFCVAGHLGGTSDWPSAMAGSLPLPLAAAGELADLVGSGWEIGCHGMTHAPLVSDTSAVVERELVEAKAVLEEKLGTAVRAFAYPYGAGPSLTARKVVSRHYDSAWTTRLGLVRQGADPHRLPRVDAHYVRRPRLLRAALDGNLRPYLEARHVGARLRRVVRPDFARTEVER